MKRVDKQHQGCKLSPFLSVTQGMVTRKKFIDGEIKGNHIL